MSKNELEPAGGMPVWPLAPQSGSELALAQDWGQRSYGGTGPGELNLATIWRIIYEWRWLILGATAVALAAAVVFTFLTTPLYRASAVLEINPPTVQILEDSKAKASSNDREYLATQYGLLASKSLAQRVAQELNLASNQDFVPGGGDRGSRLKWATGILMGNFKVDPMQGSRLVTISYTSESPGLAAQIANSFADNFINSNLERRYQASSYARGFLERQIGNVKRELEKSEKQLIAYAQAQNIINTSSGEKGGSSDVNSLQGQSLVALNDALASATSKRIAAEQAYRQAASVGNTADVTESTAPLRAERSTLEAEYQAKLSSFKPDYPDMVRLRSRIEALDAARSEEH